MMWEETLCCDYCDAEIHDKCSTTLSSEWIKETFNVDQEHFYLQHNGPIDTYKHFCKKGCWDKADKFFLSTKDKELSRVEMVRSSMIWDHKLIRKVSDKFKSNFYFISPEAARLYMKILAYDNYSKELKDDEKICITDLRIVKVKKGYIAGYGVSGGAYYQNFKLYKALGNIAIVVKKIKKSNLKNEN